MTITRAMIAASVLGLVPSLAQPAFAASGGTISVVYRAAGVKHTQNGDNTGTQTAIICTNLSNVNEDIAVVIRDAAGTIIASATVTKSPLQTHTFATKSSFFYPTTGGTNFALAADISPAGLVAVGSTTTAIVCTAAVVGAGAAAASDPQALPLHMVRYNPASGTQE